MTPDPVAEPAVIWVDTAGRDRRGYIRTFYVIEADMPRPLDCPHCHAATGGDRD
jgi:hypothetical protein